MSCTADRVNDHVWLIRWNSFMVGLRAVFLNRCLADSELEVVELAQW